jgi:short-subunit dehydrogenase
MKKAIVIGATSGIGRELAKILADTNGLADLYHEETINHHLPICLYVIDNQSKTCLNLSSLRLK